jgi:hypothetical protein
MRPASVVVDRQIFDDPARIVAVCEQALVEAQVAQAPVEALCEGQAVAAPRVRLVWGRL